MQVEVILHLTGQSYNTEKKLIDHFCIWDESKKRLNKTWVKTILQSLSISNWQLIDKDDHGHFHAISCTKSNTYQFSWYYAELIPIKKK